jgi:sporulation protein YlmC with PRC-barrel domain
MQEKLVAAIALVAGVGLAGGAVAQSSSGSSQPSSTPPPASSSSAPADQSTSPSPQPGSSSSSSQPASSGPAQAAQGVLVDANALVGATVRSPEGKDIGKVERLMVDPKDGRVRTVVIQQGGTLGIGGKSVSMPWESMEVARDGDSIVLTAEQQMLDQAPAASPRTDSKSEKNRSDSDKK